MEIFVTSKGISTVRLFEAFLMELIEKQKPSIIPKTGIELKPRLTVSEACHRLAPSEGQKENKWNR